MGSCRLASLGSVFRECFFFGLAICNSATLFDAQCTVIRRMIDENTTVFPGNYNEGRQALRNRAGLIIGVQI